MGHFHNYFIAQFKRKHKSGHFYLCLFQNQFECQKLFDKNNRCRQKINFFITYLQRKTLFNISNTVLFILFSKRSF